MSNNTNARSLQEKREDHGEIHENNKMKHGERSKTNEDTSKRENRVVPEEKLLDPVEEARKALEIFQEVSGEAIAHMIPKKDININSESEERYEEHRYLSKEKDSREVHPPLKNTNEKKPKTLSQKRKLDSDYKYASESEERKEDHVTETGKDAEEKARQKKRIEDGEARRREFRPKIARLQDSNCLL